MPPLDATIRSEELTILLVQTVDPCMGRQVPPSSRSSTLYKEPTNNFSLLSLFLSFQGFSLLWNKRKMTRRRVAGLGFAHVQYV